MEIEEKGKDKPSESHFLWTLAYIQANVALHLQSEVKSVFMS